MCAYYFPSWVVVTGAVSATGVYAVTSVVAAFAGAVTVTVEGSNREREVTSEATVYYEKSNYKSSPNDWRTVKEKPHTGKDPRLIPFHGGPTFYRHNTQRGPRVSGTLNPDRLQVSALAPTATYVPPPTPSSKGVSTPAWAGLHSKPAATASSDSSIGWSETVKSKKRLRKK